MARFKSSSRHQTENIPVDFELVGDGAEVIAHIEGAQQCGAGLKKPDAVIIDLNLPRLNGKQVPRYLRNSNQHRKTPVVIFSRSNRASDIEDCCDAGCVSHIIKPTDLEPFMGVINLVIAYWLELVELDVA